MNSMEASFWKEAADSEIQSIMSKHTWELVDLPKGCKAIGCKWIFKRKLMTDGSVERYKARLVIKGYSQKSGLDFFDTYSPVTKISTIRVLFALASIFNMAVHQMDVKTAFLNGELNEEIYMVQPPGCSTPETFNKVCKLKKSLYGLKQAPKQWFEKFNTTVSEFGFKSNGSDTCVYTKFFGDSLVIVCLYVDDMLIFSTDLSAINETKAFLSSKFEMKD
ncbi:Retrovirus-related Pol polyprotein from transposon TNT 1-94, partial [Linum grandiflorum]